LVKVIEWERPGGQSIVLKRTGKKHGSERDAGYLISILGSVLPTLIIGVLLIGTCVYRGNKQQAEFREVAEASHQEQTLRAIVRRAARIPESESPEVFKKYNQIKNIVPGERMEVPGSVLPIVVEMEEDFNTALVETIPIYEGEAFYSYYWPPLGGINCEEPCDIMANGEPWREAVGVAVACPAEFEIGSKVIWDGGAHICLDRGSAIVMQGQRPWIDFLRDRPHEGLSWGDTFYVRVFAP
jgi:hypothetical protein